MRFEIKDRIDDALRSCYILKLAFMYGDADGTEYIEHIIPEAKITDEKYMNELSEFICMLDECIALDSKGRGGIDSIAELISHYSTKSKNFSKFNYNIVENLEEDEFEDYEITAYADTPFNFYLPSTNSGFYASFKPYKLTYHNSEGQIFKVDIVK